MKRHLTAVPKAEPEELIAAVEPSRKATAKNLSSIQQKVLLKNAEAMLEESFRVLRMKVRRGDTAAIKLSFEVNSMVRAPGGVNVNTQINNSQRNEVTDGGKTFSYESLVRRLDAREIQVSSAQDLIAHDDI